MTARYSYISLVTSYIRDVEKEMFGETCPGGWERRYKKKAGGFYKAIRIGAWVAAIIATLLVLVFVPVPTGTNTPSSAVAVQLSWAPTPDPCPTGEFAHIGE